jgi:hypothetical protein
MRDSMKRHPTERGQVLVIFAGGMLTILVIAALVIDLGFTFMIRRAEQNAADPGAIAAARYIKPTVDAVCPDTGLGTGCGQMRRAACFYARQNGFFPFATDNDGCTAANDPNGTQLIVNYPPGPGAGERFPGMDQHVEVILSRQHQSFLAQLVGIRSIGVTGEAVAAFDEGDSNSNSLVALDNRNTCQAGKTHGTGNILIHPLPGVGDGGYIHVNSTCGTGAMNGACENSGQGGLDVTGSGTVTAPHTYVSGTCKANGGLFPTGELTEGAQQIGDPLAELPPPSFGPPGAECGVGSGNFTSPTGPGANGCKFNSAGTINLNPGTYYGGWDIGNNVELVLAPGIYVFAGGGVKLNAGGTITSVQGGSGAPAPVMFYNTDNPATGTGQANLDFTATSTLKVHAIASGPYKGILVWNDGKGSNASAQVTLGGQVSLDIAGTIYNPKGLVKLEGGSGVGSTAAVQIIAWQFDVGGNANLDMPYDPAELYQFPSKGLVH